MKEGFILASVIDSIFHKQLRVFCYYWLVKKVCRMELLCLKGFPLLETLSA
jgi:hypothetical protein